MAQITQGTVTQLGLAGQWLWVSVGNRTLRAQATTNISSNRVTVMIDDRGRVTISDPNAARQVLPPRTERFHQGQRRKIPVSYKFVPCALFTIDNNAGDCRFPDVANLIPVNNILTWDRTPPSSSEVTIFSNKTYCYWDGVHPVQSLVTIPGSDVVATGTTTSSTEDWVVAHTISLSGAPRYVPEPIAEGTFLNPGSPSRSPVFYCAYTSSFSIGVMFASGISSGVPVRKPVGTTTNRQTAATHEGLPIFLSKASLDNTTNVPSQVYLLIPPTPAGASLIEWEIRIAREGSAYMSVSPQGTSILIYRSGIDSDPYCRSWYYEAPVKKPAQEKIIASREDTPDHDFRSVFLDRSAIAYSPNLDWGFFGTNLGTISAGLKQKKAWFLGEDLSAVPSIYSAYGNFIQGLFGAGWQFHVESGRIRFFNKDTGQMNLSLTATGNNVFFNAVSSKKIAIPLNDIPEYSGNIATVCVPSLWDSNSGFKPAYFWPFLGICEAPRR